MDETTIQALQWLALATGVLLLFVATIVLTNWIMGWADRHPIRREEVDTQEDGLLSFLRAEDRQSSGLPEPEATLVDVNGGRARTHEPAA